MIVEEQIRKQLENRQIQNTAAEGIGGDPCRESTAKEILVMNAKRMHAEADALERLAKALPDEMNYQADQALKNLLVAARR